MKKILLLAFALTLPLGLTSCYFLISKPIYTEIDFTNMTGDRIRLACKKSKNIITIDNKNSSKLDLSNYFVRIYFSDSDDFLEYNLSHFESIATIDKDKSGTCLWGHIHWIYPCKILKNKTLVFYESDNDILIIYPVSFKKSRVILQKKAKAFDSGREQPEIIYPPNKDNQKSNTQLINILGN